MGFFLRDNILAYLMVLFCTQVAGPIVELLSQANSFFVENGVALALLTAVVLVWMVWSPGGVEEVSSQ